ncbi:hypothetical protein ACFL0V_02245 [Nanoarchaeota archaeon]
MLKTFTAILASLYLATPAVANPHYISERQPSGDYNHLLCSQEQRFNIRSDLCIDQDRPNDIPQLYPPTSTTTIEGRIPPSDRVSMGEAATEENRRDYARTSDVGSTEAIPPFPFGVQFVLELD